MPAVLAAGFRPVYLGLFWGVIHSMSMPSLATATRPSYFFRADGSGPLLGQTVLDTWVCANRDRCSRVCVFPAQILNKGRVRVVHLRHFSGLLGFGSHFQIKYGSGLVPCSIFMGLFGFGYECLYP